MDEVEGVDAAIGEVGGGAAVTLATTNQVRFDVVTQDATHLYWNRGADIVRVAKAGGAVETLVVGAEPVIAAAAPGGVRARRSGRG